MVILLLFVGALAALYVITRVHSFWTRIGAWIVGLVCLVGFLAMVAHAH